MTEIAPIRRARRYARFASAALAALLVAQIVLVGAGLVKAANLPSVDEPHIVPVESPADRLPLTPETGQPLAVQYAQQWKADARLVGAMMHLNWPDTVDPSTSTQLPTDGWLLYQFASGDQLLAIYIDRGSGDLTGSSVSRQGGPEWRQIDPASFPKSSTVAGLTGEMLGGRDYREACPDRRQTSVVSFGLLPNADGSTRAAWTVTYEDRNRGDRLGVRVRLDATTGDVIDNVAADATCED